MNIELHPGVTPHPAVYEQYWEDRATRYASEGDGLRAVCSYGMPGFYNRYIDMTHRLAMQPWLQVDAGTEVLDFGCGVGRWSLQLAARGANVTGMDLSPTMVAEATERAWRAGLEDRCRFLVGDVAEIDLGKTFDLVIGVTVLQHVIDPDRLRRAFDGLAAHVRPGGRMVMLEVAPSHAVRRCDSTIFRARDVEAYLDLFAGSSLELQYVTGVDPLPLKTAYLPWHRRLPRPVALAGLAAVTAASAAFDGAFGRGVVGPSWHKVFVLQQPIREDFGCPEELAMSA